MSKSKKQDTRKGQKTEILLSTEESGELRMVLDRLKVQNPEGESLRSYLESLRNALSGRENMVAALIERLSRNPSEVGFQAFLNLRDLVGNKMYLKTVKLAAYRFGQRGYSTPPETSRTDKIVLVQGEERDSIAHMAPSAETFWFVSGLVHDAGSVEPVGFAAYADRDFERLLVKSVESSHKLYRDLLQRVSRHFPHKPVEIPLWHAAGLFHDLLDFSRIKDLYAEGERARRLLRPYFSPDRPPYAYELMPAVEQSEREIRGLDVKSLLEEAAVYWLFFPKQDLQVYNEKIEELDHPVLVIPPEVQQERTESLMKKAAEELCVGRWRTIYRRFFEEYAMYYKLSGEESLASSSWLVAQHLRSDASAGENPAVVELVIMAINYHWPRTPDGRDKQGEEKDKYFRETDSGLIIPR